MFNCNELPTGIEHTHAFFRRFLIIPFKVTIKEENQDRNLSTKIIKDELPGVFNWILIGMNRLLKNKGFTPSSIVEKEAEKFRRESDSVLCFIDDNKYEISFDKAIKIAKQYGINKPYVTRLVNDSIYWEIMNWKNIKFDTITNRGADIGKGVLINRRNGKTEKIERKTNWVQ
jgi:putative DNA primase/helicase